jgi:hypothetical protein
MVPFAPPEDCGRIAKQGVIVSPTIQILFREMLELEQKVRDGLLKPTDKRSGLRCIGGMRQSD